MRWWRWLLIGVFAGLCSAAFAAPITDLALLRLLQNAPTAAGYPADDALVLLKDLDITIDAAGGTVVRDHRMIKILTERGLSLADWEIPYDKSCEQVDVATARVLLNGYEFPVDTRQMAESAVYPGIGWYDALVVRRFPFPAVQPGAVLDVETVTRRPAARMPGEFGTRLHLQQTYPVLDSHYTIRVPADRRLDIRFTGELSPAVRERVDKGQRSYAWSCERVPPLRIAEAQTPPAEDLIASARIATQESWAPIVAWYQATTAGKDAVTDDVRRVAEERTAGCTSAEAKLLALHQAVRGLPYVGIEMGTLSDVPHPADEVLRRNYGDCKDKATLLRALLRAAGVDADYVLVRTTDRGRLDPQLCSPTEFNHVILCVRLPAGDRFIDATIADAPATLLPPGVEGADALLVRGAGELVQLPQSTAAENRTSVRVSVTLQTDGSATGTAVLAFTGQSAVVQRGMLAQVPPARYREALEGTLAPRLGAEAAIDSVTVDGLDAPERPLTITATFTSPAFMQPAEAGRYSGFLPSFMFRQNTLRTIKQRTYPFVQRLESSLHEEVVITLPPGVEVTHLPAPVTYDGPAGSYRDEARADDGVIAYTCDMATRRGEFPATALDDFRRWAGILALEGRTQLQFFLRRP